MPYDRSMCGNAPCGHVLNDARAYDAYAEGEAPPEPWPPSPPEPVNRRAAEAELMHKNILLPS